jgi:hypothetical protein
MHRVIVTLVALVLSASASASAAPRIFDFSSREAILGWINTYRSNPDPARVPAAMQGLARLGLLRDPEASGVFVGFLAGVLAANPGKAEEIVTRMFPFPAEQHWAIVRAIAYSGLPEWQRLMTRVGERMPTRRVMIEKFAAGKLPTLDAAPIEKDPTFGEKVRAQFTLAKLFTKPSEEVKLELTPDLLDTLWGNYFATGSYRPLARIIVMLRWSKERDVIEKLTLGSMAKYTLAVNAARNAELLHQLKWSVGQQPETIKPILIKVIEAAETAETGRLRNEALAAIEDLKRKGPGYKREISMWGQVGEGALAVGCIVAAVAGQVEFGIPCVVGGVATSAALRFWEGQQQQ